MINDARFLRKRLLQSQLFYGWRYVKKKKLLNKRFRASVK